MRLVAALALLLAAAPAGARSLPDLAVHGVLRAHDASLSSLDVRRRVAVTEELDLVVAVGSHGGWRPGQPVPRGPARLGLFLQDRARPDLVYTLAIEPCPCGAEPVIERVTATDTVLSCEHEKHELGPNEKFVYDVRAKALVGRRADPPVGMARLFETPSGAVAVGTDGTRLVAVAFTPDADPPLRILDGAEASRWTRRVKLEGERPGELSFADDEWRRDHLFGPGRGFRLAPLEDGRTLIREDGVRRTWRLPQSTIADYARARPEHAEGTGLDMTIEEDVGPHENEGDLLWFGKSYYCGEGNAGVGGFGFFDPATRSFTLHAPPEIADWSVVALDVTPDALWMALAHHGEYGPSSGGILRWDRATEAVTTYPLRDVASGILRIGDRTLVTTERGFAVVTRDGAVRRWFVDLTTDGRLRIAEAIGAD